MGFNEAGAIKPRKTRPALTTPWTRLCGFNEAGAIKPRKTNVSDDEYKTDVYASMRPGQSSPGKLRCPAIHGQSRMASMRPGQSSPGKLVLLLAICLLRRHASMRPGQSSPGKRPQWTAIPGGCKGFNEAGAIKPRKTGPTNKSRPLSYMLQ